MISDWIISNKESHPKKVIGSIFRSLGCDCNSRVVARIIKYRYCKHDYWIGFVCGKSKVSNKYNECYYDNSFEFKDEAIEVVAFMTDLKLVEMGYKLKNIGWSI